MWWFQQTQFHCPHTLTSTVLVSLSLYINSNSWFHCPHMVYINSNSWFHCPHMVYINSNSWFHCPHMVYINSNSWFHCPHMVMSTLLVSLSSNVNIKSPDVSIMGSATSTKGGGGWGGGGGVRKAGWLYHRTYRPRHASGVHVWWDWRSGCSILPLTRWGWGYGQRWMVCRWGPLGTHSPSAALGAASWASWACTSRTTRTQWALQITCTWIRPLREKTWMVSKVWLIPVLNMSWEYGLYLSWTCPESMAYTCPEHVLRVWLIPVLNMSWK